MNLKVNSMKEPRYLVDYAYMADPSAHVFNGKIYIYPSHDVESEFLKTTTVIILICGIITFFLWNL